MGSEVVSIPSEAVFVSNTYAVAMYLRASLIDLDGNEVDEGYTMPL